MSAPFRYLDVCAGISALTVAARQLGWQCAGYSEIEAFPRAVLQDRYGAVPVNWEHRHAPGQNSTPLFGDFTKIEAHHVGPVDLVCGGTPCQDFSIAGLRKGLAGDRGNLTLEFVRLADRLRPQWLGWENVVGVLSQNKGRDFGTFLGALGELGYGFAYRVYDAQFCRVDGHARAVPQRRRRVILVGCLGDWRRAAAVLFDAESLSGNPPPRREAGKSVALSLDASAARRRGSGQNPNTLTPVSPTLRAGGNKTGGDRPPGTDVDTCDSLIVDYVPPIVGQAMSSKWAKRSSGPAGDEVANLVAHALRGEGFDASEDGTGRGTPLVPVLAFPEYMGSTACASTENVSPALGALNPTAITCTAKDHGGVMPAVAFQDRFRGDDGRGYDRPPAAMVEHTGSLETVKHWHVAQQWAVRRLTPLECERLQGFPDGHTAIRYRGKLAADGPRYKALGNSMAVNVIVAVMTRLDIVNRIPLDIEAAA